MSVYISNHVWLHSRHKGSELLLVLALADQADDEGICWPSVEWLAHKTRLSARAVQYLLPKVLDGGEVVVVGRRPGGHGTPVYQVVAPAMPVRAATPKHRGANFAPHSAPTPAGVQKTPAGVQKSETGVQLLPAGVQKTPAGVQHVAPESFNRSEPLREPGEPARVRAGAREIAPVLTENGVVRFDRTCRGCGEFSNYAAGEGQGYCTRCLPRIPATPVEQAQAQ